MNRNLKKAVMAVLGTAALGGVSSQATAVGMSGDLTSIINNPVGATFTARPAYVWDGGNIGYGNLGVGDCVSNDCGNLPVPNRARTGGANPMSGSVEDDRNMGWNHTSTWYSFYVSSDGGYTISMDRTSTNTNNQPAFSVWATNAQYLNQNGSHKFNQVIAPISQTPDLLNANGRFFDNGNDYMLPNDSGNQNVSAYVTAFVGYANSGPGYVNAGGNTVLGALTFGTSVEGPRVNPANPYNANTNPYTSLVSKGNYVNSHAGLITAPYAGSGSSVNTSDPRLANANGGGHVDLQLWLPAGWYIMTGGGSCADFTCSPSSTAAVMSDYTVKIMPNANVTAPVPVPAAVWLFGSALAGLGVIGRRKDKPAA